jgi:hypothetical protein
MTPTSHLPTEDEAVIALRSGPRAAPAAPAAVVAMRETAIIAAVGFLVFIMTAALLVHFLVP